MKVLDINYIFATTLVIYDSEIITNNNLVCITMITALSLTHQEMRI